MTSAAPFPGPVTYRPIRGAQVLYPAGFVLFAVVAVGLVVAEVRGSGPPLWFAVLWLALLCWNGYWLLGRMCLELTLDGSQLRWRTAVRSGAVPVTDVLRVRQARTSRQLAVVELRDRRPLLVQVRYGFGALERALTGSAVEQP